MATSPTTDQSKKGETVCSVAYIKRKPGLSPEEFYHHWEHVHGELVKPWFKKHGFVSYTQVHATPALNKDAQPIGPESKSVSPLAEFDGCAIMEVPSFEVFAAAFNDPYYIDVIAPDEERFIDKKVGVNRTRGEVKKIM